MAIRAAIGVVITALMLVGCSQTTATAPETGKWRVEVVAQGLDHPWGLAVLPDESLLITERAGRISTVRDGKVAQIAAIDDVRAGGEGGLMGLTLSPDFAVDRRFFVCTATTHGDVQIIPFVLAQDQATAERQSALVTGIALNPSGRHSGCRLRIGADKMLYAGVGDAALGTNPQDPNALGGKVLRVDPASGQAPPGNPFVSSDNPAARLVFTLGHRNVQGLAVQPVTGVMYSAEHGPDVDDEVNKLMPGSNYGWNPVGSRSYDESVPMTDDSITGAVPAVWSSGDSTIAASGCAFLEGKAWGKWQGQLAVAALKGSALYLLDISDDGTLRGTTKAQVLDGDYGRLRTVEPAGDGAILVTTSNGGDDKIVRVTP